MTTGLLYMSRTPAPWPKWFDALHPAFRCVGLVEHSLPPPVARAPLPRRVVSTFSMTLFETNPESLYLYTLAGGQMVQAVLEMVTGSTHSRALIPQMEVVRRGSAGPPLYPLVVAAHPDPADQDGAAIRWCSADLEW